MISGISAQGVVEGESVYIFRSILHVLKTNDSPEDRYNAFKDVVSRFHEGCRATAFSNVIEVSHLDTAKKEAIKSEINSFYAQHVQNYPEKSKQAILDGQTSSLIAQNTGLPSYALCHQIHTLATSKVEAAKGK